VPRPAAILIALLFAGTAACADNSPERSDGPSGELVVFAASSLTEAFIEIGAAFDDTHPSVHVTFSFAGSGALANQIREGAPADVFAAADTISIEAAADDLEGPPVVFARNTFTIVVERGNPRVSPGWPT